MAPFDLNLLLGATGSSLVYLAIGFAFGFILESAGFGDSRRLAAQFYFRELRVLKVMFTAIIVAMTLIFLSTALGLLDFDDVWVNPTYLWPGIVGGLIMGVGFIIGGYCPGTSLVSMATLKVDGAFFVMGVVAGVLAFGESVAYFNDFWHSSFMGRFTLPEMLGMDTGVVVFALVIVALLMFWGFGLISKAIYRENEDHSPLKLRLSAALLLLLLSASLIFYKQPDLDKNWTFLAAEYGTRLEQREVYIDPAELLQLMNNDYVELILYDLRNESDWNQFHLVDAERVPLEQLAEQRDRIKSLPQNAVIVLVSNDEILSTRAWKRLMALAKPNAYILEGGINHWLNVYGVADEEVGAHGAASLEIQDGTLR
ncbi:MAG: YeeE/YedE thiosulfate transporter family protein, partial [Gammaproteobacteria bacterium]